MCILLIIFENNLNPFIYGLSECYVYEDNTHNKKNIIEILTIITASIIFSTISSQLTSTAFGAKSNAGF
jgi:hypothetical protein